MKSLGVELKQEEPWGKLFPVTDSARTVLDALLTRVRDLSVETRFGFRATNLAREPDADTPLWQIRSVTGEIITARRVIVATGGKALPKSGSDGAGYEWLNRLGHTIIPPVPALAPLVLDERGVDASPLSTHFAELSGVAIEAWLSGAACGSSAYGPILFTHFGLSGPAPMNLSRHLARERAEHPHKKQTIGLIFDLPMEPGHDRSNGPLANSWLLLAQKRTPKASIANVLSRAMPDRLAQLLASTVENKRMCDLTRSDRDRLVRVLAGSPLAV
jgi:predicted Rossmann fold flavoprotein